MMILNGISQRQPGDGCWGGVGRVAEGRGGDSLDIDIAR